MYGRILKSNGQPGSPPVKSHAFPLLSGDASPKTGIAPEAPSAFIPHIVLSSPEGAAPTSPHMDQGPSPGSTVSQQLSNDVADRQRLFDNLQQAIVDMQSISRNTTREVENSVGLMALHLARCMVSHAAGTNPETVLSNLAMALKSAQELEIISIRLNPEDLETVAGSLKSLPGPTGQQKDLILKKDPGIERGGCLIETTSGVVDATREHQFSTLMDSFQQAVKP